MENRRPPRNNAFGARSYGDRPHRPPGSRPSQFMRNDSERDRSRPPSSIGDRYQPRGRNDGSGFERRPRPNNGYSRPEQRFDRPYGKPGRFNPRGRVQTKRKPLVRDEDRSPITSDLQITDGKYRGHLLENSLSPNARPTARKLREILFKVASRRVRAGRFLDLGAGMGVVGLEAISRGAMIGTFVERSARMCSFIRKNTAALGVKDGHAEIVENEISPFLKSTVRRRRRWDLVFLGTRSGMNDEETLRFFGRGVPLAPGGLLLIEHATEQEFPEKMGVLKRWRTIANDNSSVTFYERK